MPVEARRPIRRMRGGAQAYLIEANDGCFYVVKFLNNPQHRRILINEMLGAHLLRNLQVTTPEPVLVNLSEAFLAAYPEVYLELGTRREPVRPGWHYGSRFPGDPARQAVFDFLPDSLIGQVLNLRHFLGVLVADKWLSNADARQAVYYRAQVKLWDQAGSLAGRKSGFIASMIDQGYFFNGPNWELTGTPLQGLALRPAVYAGVRSLDDFQPWLDMVAGFPESVLDSARRQIPGQWLDGDENELDALLEKLLARRRTVADLILAVRRARPSLFPMWS